MTAQAKDTILINNEAYSINSAPLSKYLETFELNFELASLRTGMRRGYIAKWKIEENRLYLVEFMGINDLLQEEYFLSDLFPDNSEKVFAGWFSGEIIIAAGKEIHYDAGYLGTINEFNTTISIENGFIKNPGFFLIEGINP